MEREVVGRDGARLICCRIEQQVRASEHIKIVRNIGKNVNRNEKKRKYVS